MLNVSYAYRIVKINECLNADDLLHIVNENLTKNERVKILNMTENSLFVSQQYFVDMEEDSDYISEIEEEEISDFS